MILLLPFQSEYLLFLFLVWMLWLGLTILCWIEVVRVGFLSCSRFQQEGFQFFTIENYIGCGSVINNLYYAEIYSLYTHFVKNFYHKWILNFIKCVFLYLLRWSYDHMVFILQFVNMVYHIDWFAYIEPSLWPCDESNLVVV